MNYIVFDLEWNIGSGTESEDPRMPFEIIEIGAVKLDKKFNIIDTYSSIIKPRLYRRLQPHIRSILNYDERTLRAGRPFDIVCREFIKWIGKEDYMFCTWGPNDLYYLQTNMDYYYMRPLANPLKFYNIQQIYADTTDPEGAIAKLEKAVTFLNIEADRPFHSAVNDAYYTGLVMSKIIPKDLEDRFSYDTYNVPKDKESELISYHKQYMEHISREFSDKKAATSDKDLFSATCYKCKKKLSKKIRWFTHTPSTYLCAGKCWYHGLVLGKIKIKQSRNGNYFAIKTMSPTDKKGFEQLKDRQDELRLRRQEKRHKDHSNDIELED